MAEDGLAEIRVDIAGNQLDATEAMLAKGSVGLVWPGAVEFSPQGFGLTVTHFGGGAAARSAAAGRGGPAHPRKAAGRQPLRF